MHTEVYDHVYAQVSELVYTQVYEHVYGQVSELVYTQVYEHVYAQVYEHVYAQVYEHVYAQVYEHVYAQVYTKAGAEAGLVMHEAYWYMCMRMLFKQKAMMCNWMVMIIHNRFSKCTCGLDHGSIHVIPPWVYP